MTWIEELTARAVRELINVGILEQKREGVIDVGASRRSDVDVEQEDAQCLRVKRGEKSNIASHSKLRRIAPWVTNL